MPGRFAATKRPSVRLDGGLACRKTGMGLHAAPTQTAWLKRSDRFALLVSSTPPKVDSSPRPFGPGLFFAPKARLRAVKEAEWVQKKGANLEGLKAASALFPLGPHATNTAAKWEPEIQVECPGLGGGFQPDFEQVLTTPASAASSARPRRWRLCPGCPAGPRTQPDGGRRCRTRGFPASRNPPAPGRPACRFQARPAP